jgi:hypothetical protein
MPQKTGPKPIKQDVWIQRVHEIGKGEYELLSIVEKCDIPAKFRHLTCGTEFEKRPNEWRRLGGWCPTCRPVGAKSVKSSGFRDTISSVQAKLDIKNGDGVFTIISDTYVNNHTPINIRHICGHEWSACTGHLLKNTNTPKCPKCAIAKMSHTHEQFLERVANSLEGSEYEVLTDYVDIKTNVVFKHTSCGSTFYTSPINFLHALTRCPNCSKAQNSKYLRQALVMLNNLDVKYNLEQTFEGVMTVSGKNFLKFDIYLTELDALIEIDGEFHFSPQNFPSGKKSFEITKANDALRDQFAATYNIPFKRISYLDNIDKEIKTFIDTLIESRHGTTNS